MGKITNRLKSVFSRANDAPVQKQRAPAASRAATKMGPVVARVTKELSPSSIKNRAVDSHKDIYQAVKSVQSYKGLNQKIKDRGAKSENLLARNQLIQTGLASPSAKRIMEELGGDKDPTSFTLEHFGLDQPKAEKALNALVKGSVNADVWAKKVAEVGSEEPKKAISFQIRESIKDGAASALAAGATKAEAKAYSKEAGQDAAAILADIVLDAAPGNEKTARLVLMLGSALARSFVSKDGETLSHVHHNPADAIALATQGKTKRSISRASNWTQAKALPVLNAVTYGRIASRGVKRGITYGAIAPAASAVYTGARATVATAATAVVGTGVAAGTLTGGAIGFAGGLLHLGGGMGAALGANLGAKTSLGVAETLIGVGGQQSFSGATTYGFKARGRSALETLTSHAIAPVERVILTRANTLMVEATGNMTRNNS